MQNDLYYRLRHDPEFLAKIGKLADRIQISSAKAERDSMAAAGRNKDLIELYRTSNFNPGLMIPYFFPAYPKQKPLSLRSRPFVFAMLDFIVGGYLVIRASRQIGKCLTFNNLHKIKRESKGESEVSTQKLFDLCEKNSI